MYDLLNFHRQELYLHANLYTYTVLYKEYRSLKSKMNVGGSKSFTGTESKNSVFGAHLNKEKSLTGRKPLLYSANSKTLGWSKQHGWTIFKNMPHNDKPPKSDCREVKEVRVIVCTFSSIQ